MKNTIHCPNCQSEINVNEVLYNQLKVQITSENQNIFEAKEKKIQEEFQNLEKFKLDLKKENETIKIKYEEELAKKLNQEKERLEQEIKAKVSIENEAKNIALQEELSQKSKQIIALNQEKELLNQKENDLNFKVQEIENTKIQILKEREEAKAKFEEELNTKLKNEKLILEQQISQKIQQENSEQYKLLQEELEEKSNQLKELNKSKAEIEKLKREKNELREQIELEKLQEFNKQLEEEKSKIKIKANEENFLKIKELEKQLDDQRKLAEEMKRKAEQGSMQLQGEIQEIALKDLLADLFRFDLIEDVPKGVNGADLIQIVHNKVGKIAGKIIFESKRTKAFSNDWISKLKYDQSLVKADIAVIVSETLPKGEDEISQIDGVWICSFASVGGLVIVLRDSLIKINQALDSQVNKGEKMQMLYDYLTGQEFQQQIIAIMEGFLELQKGYNKEKLQMQKIWKEREKQLEKVLLNTNHFLGSVKGIAGASFQDINLLANNNDENFLL